MPTLRQINRRIKSIQSTAKTTRAMSLVAGSKMRRAQQLALAHRPYADHLHQLLGDVVHSLEAMAVEAERELHPLLARRENKNPLVIVLTSDRGQVGGMNTNLIRIAGNYLVQHPTAQLITVGRKGYDFYRRTNTTIAGHFLRLGDYPTFDDVRPISVMAANAFINGDVDSVNLVYPRFINTVVQRPELQELLPATPPEDDDDLTDEYIFEPDAQTVLEELLPRYVEIQVYRAVLELAASEQSARMVAMRNATDAALEMVQNLTLLRNKVRQEQITKELLDITGGVEAMKN
ncbi:MAG: ATP synthase F1 subunit gamma [Dehalococcoidia bacterium]